MHGSVVAIGLFTVHMLPRDITLTVCPGGRTYLAQPIRVPVDQFADVLEAIILDHVVCMGVEDGVV